ncbi:MAG TPA: AMP-binding protein, partial [Thermomicrobiales bacterium]
MVAIEPASTLANPAPEPSLDDMPIEPPVRIEQLVDEALTDPGRVTLIHGDGCWTGGELRREIRRRAAIVHERGLAVGDTVVTTERLSAEMLISCLACCQQGVIFCHLSPQYTAEELLPLVGRAGARTVLTREGAAHPLLPGLAALPLGLPDEPRGVNPIAPTASRSAEAPALLAATSGTTARMPKLAVIPHRALTWRRHLPTWSEAQQGTTASTIQSFKGLLHQFCIAIAQGNRFLITGTTAPAKLETELARHRVHDLITQPTILNLLLENPLPPPTGLRLRTIRSGSAALPPALADAITARYGATVIQNLSSTESSQIIGVPESGAPGGSLGKPYTGVAVRIVDAAGVEVPQGQQGELLVRHPGLMLGYLGDPEATAEALRDGWYWTGDLAYRDAGGFLFF